MCHLSNYYVSVSNLPFFVLPCVTGATKHFPFASGKVLGPVIRGHQRDTQRQWQQEGNSHQGSSPPFFNSGWSPVVCTVRPCSPNLTALASFLATGNLCVPVTAINFSVVGDSVPSHSTVPQPGVDSCFVTPVTPGPL